MRKEMRGLAAALSVSLGLFGHAYAADISIRIDGIEGGAASHAGEIEVQSFSWGATHSGSPTGGGGGAGKVSFTDLNFVAEMSKATPKLLEACATGKHIPRAILTCRKTGGSEEYLVVTMEDVLITSYQTSGSGGDHEAPPPPPPPKGKKGKKAPPPPTPEPPTVPLESVSLNFTKVTYSYRGGDEVIEFGWDVDTNTGL